MFNRANKLKEIKSAPSAGFDTRSCELISASDAGIDDQTAPSTLDTRSDPKRSYEFVILQTKFVGRDARGWVYS